MNHDQLIQGLNEDPAAELGTVIRGHYLAHARLAEQLELPELKMKLEEMAADEAGHGRELRRLLKGL